MSIIPKAVPAKFCKPQSHSSSKLVFQAILWLKTIHLCSSNDLLAAHHSQEPRSGQEGEKADKSLKQRIPWIRVNSRDETRGPWLKSRPGGNNSDDHLKPLEGS